MRMGRCFLGALLLAFASIGSLLASDPVGDTYPTKERLFYIARSVNRNLVCYDARLKEGRLDLKDPLEIYWINREEQVGEKSGLSYIQRKMAYGYKLVSAAGDSAVCSLTAYPKRTLTVARQKGGDGYVCHMVIDRQRAVLRSLYVKTHPKNPLNVEYVELIGIAEGTGQEVTERIYK